MDLNLLNKMSTEGLMKLQDAVKGVLESRLDTRVYPGRTATFTDKAGCDRTVRIEKLNRTTVSCVEISPKAGTRWRVSVSALKVTPQERKVPAPAVKFQAPVKPANYGNDIW